VSKKNPLAEVTAEHNLKRCAMGRCCNAAEIVSLKDEIKEIKKALKLYAEIKIEGYPNLGDTARRVLGE
jgi:hypothetical protein